MKQFRDRIAVVTGAGTGIGRELARQLSAEGCHVAIGDVSAEAMAETKALCAQTASTGTQVTTHLCDVADEAQVLALRDAVVREHATDHVHLVFNNAGIGGGSSLFTDPREQWDRTFAVCWGGVYHGTRAFLPLLVAAPEGHLVNVSSINGFWASFGPDTPHTAYSTAKFAVKGFTEALITDLRLNAPHVRASVVMPGHVGTPIFLNSLAALTRARSKEETSAAWGVVRDRLAKRGLDVAHWSDDQLQAAMQRMGEDYRDRAPLSAAAAATIILDGVREGRWRILVGADAEELDRMVRASPESAYDPEFVRELVAKGHFQGLAPGR